MSILFQEDRERERFVKVIETVIGSLLLLVVAVWLKWYLVDMLWANEGIVVHTSYPPTIGQLISTILIVFISGLIYLTKASRGKRNFLFRTSLSIYISILAIDCIVGGSFLYHIRVDWMRVLVLLITVLASICVSIRMSAYQKIEIFASVFSALLILLVHISILFIFR